MNNWLNQLERKYGRFGIPNLTNILVGGQILVLAIELFVNQTVSVWLALSRYFLLRGQIWRIITFAFIPSYGGSILSAVLGIYFTWFIGTALEQEWGDFRYTVYLLSGMLGTVLACLLTGVTGSTYCLSLSLLLAFAMLYPEVQLLLFFVIPIRVKYFGVFAAFGTELLLTNAGALDTIIDGRILEECLWNCRSHLRSSSRANRSPLRWRSRSARSRSAGAW